MPRKQVGAIDAELLAEVDARALALGQTRRVFIERALRERLSQAPLPPEFIAPDDPHRQIFPPSKRPQVRVQVAPRRHADNCKCPVCAS